MAVAITREPEPFRTNFASGDYDRARLIAAGIYTASLIGFLVAALMGWAGLTEQREAKAMQDNLARVQQHAARVRGELKTMGLVADDPAAVAALTKRVEILNQILEQKAFSWTTLLNELESVVPKNVSLRSVQPDDRKGEVKLQGVALTLADLTALMTAMEHSGRFADVFLQQQRTTDENRVEFSIQSTYRRTGP